MSDGLVAFIKVHTARFIVTPECAVFAKNSKKNTEIKSDSDTKNDKVENHDNNMNGMDIEKEVKEVENEGDCEWELIIALRDTPHLTYLHCGTYEQRFVTLNETAWDTHCSFTPLHLAVSPNHKYLLIATDKNFHFIVKIGESKRLRLLAGGHSSGDFGKPRVSWDCTGKYIYCNNEDGTSITVYSISTEKPVRSLSAHSGSVRDVISHPSKSLVASASYDKSVILFSTKNI